MVISLTIEFISESQDVLGAIFDAKTAPFAPFNNNMEFSMRDFYFVNIQRDSPISHISLPVFLGWNYPMSQGRQKQISSKRRDVVITLQHISFLQ
jgi:hypothetical protein